jgi:hypothetical protein
MLSIILLSQAYIMGNTASQAYTMSNTAEPSISLLTQVYTMNKTADPRLASGSILAYASDDITGALTYLGAYASSCSGVPLSFMMLLLVSDSP